MNWRLMCKLIVLSLIVLATGAKAFTGNLSSPANELDGTGFWVTEGTTITWAVTQMSGFWNYDYTLVVPRADISHFIIEVSDNFTGNDFWNVQVLQGGVTSTGLGLSTAPPVGNPGQQPNPFMPADIYGIKFDGTSGTTLQVNFNSSRAPKWGDFYAKCGNVGGTQNTVWNLGFADADPIALAADGSLAYHMLVPDTVPEPASVIALMTGIVGLIVRRRTK